ncbi:NAD(P)H-dependent flavin oxidoreductase [Brackiella oedipodis]|uniref:NAD(P)H-dependent flavin oxidoreductase n=1 Tax=Brackiella oedipodis TaxID=124225 RepID=UPI00048CA471|nr:nitronate monooxygenase family protein [Brackiella oedipodis]
MATSLHPTVAKLYQDMRLPVICSPLFIISNPKLLIQQCLNGVIGSMPALNARPAEQFEEWMAEIHNTLSQAKAEQPDAKIAPYAINQIIHKSNDRLAHDLDVCEQYQTPIIITSLGKPTDVVKKVHAWGGLVFHDVISKKHALKAIEAGVDGIIVVAAGAGGHAGQLSPFALVAEIREIFDGPIVLSGAITTGQHILAARAMGADFAYMGTRFIATPEARAVDAYKQMLVDSYAEDILYTPYFTGIPGNYLSPSVVAAGLDPQHLDLADKAKTNFGSDRKKAWKDIWGAGQGVGSIKAIMPTAQVIAQLQEQYLAAKQALLDSNM